MTERNCSLDTLRAAAVTMVVVHHAAMVMPLPTPLAHALRVGERGVDLFFVLSGYLVGGIALREFRDRGGINLLRFWRQRWFRTLPAYYVTLALYAAKEFVPHRSPGLDPILAYFVFAQTYAIGPLRDFAHSWSLCVEEHFYLVLPLFLVVCARFRVLRGRAVLVPLGVLGASLLVARVVLATEHHQQQLSHWRTDGLVAGVMLAGLEVWFGIRDRLVARLRWLRAGVALTTVAWLASEFSGFWGWQTAAALTSLSWVALAVSRAGSIESVGAHPFVALVSRISYSLYLLHPLVGGALDLVWYSHTDRGAVASLLYLSAMACLSFVAAQLFYKCIEAPALRLRDRLNPRA